MISDGSTTLIFSLAYLFVGFGLLRTVKDLSRTPKRLAKRRMRQIGGELVDVMNSTPLLDRSRPYLKEALEIEERLIEEGKAEKAKRDRMGGAHKVVYKLDGQEKSAYIVIYADRVQVIFKDYRHFDWIEEDPGQIIRKLK